MISKFLIAFFALGCIFGMSIADDLTIQTSTGILHGKRSEALSKSLRLFLGIPYAEPPIGNLRFKRPIEIFSEGIERDATRFGPSCYQSPHLESVISPLLKPNRAAISEDCLYLNVYVPDVRQSEFPLPVMVWLTGEGFNFGDPQQFDASYLAAVGKVIVVTVNYRVGAFGFLHGLSSEAPGNVGLFDQRMALRWVKKNIAHFGGNPESVTLFGRFTGSMSAAIHAFSPLSKVEKLFNRVILQSGVPVGEWIFERNPLNATFALAKGTNCFSENVTQVIHCLRKVPADILLSSANLVSQPWRPSYDFELIFQNTLKAVRKGDYEVIDVLLGITNDEGTLCTIALDAMKSPLYKKFVEGTLTSQDFDELLVSNMLDVYKVNDALMNKLAIYNYKTPELSRLREKFVNFCGDMHITAHTMKLADLLAEKKQKIFAYEFTHRPSFSIHPQFIRAGHGDDVLFTMGLPLQLENLPEEERRLTHHMMKMIVNFARSGNPNFDDLEANWPQYTSEGRQIMKISEESRVERSSHDRSVEFWHDIIPTAEKQECPPPAVAALLAAANPEVNEPREVNFLGSRLSIPSADVIFHHSMVNHP
ncbi:Cholinesterase, partial [Stegodyphus mimosarum]